jgi:aspartate aminotransferase
VAAIRKALDDKRDLSFQYTPYGGKTDLRRVIATQLSRRFGQTLHFRDVVMTPGAMSGVNTVFRTLCDEDQELLVLTPCWLDYPLYLANLGIPFRFVPLGADKHLDLEAIRAAIASRTRGIILTHPGCPSGVLLSHEELQGLADVIREAERLHGTRIFVISDEVHRDVIWADTAFETALSFHPRTLAIYSFGKSLFLQGQRIGYVVVSPRMPEREELRQNVERAVRAMGFCTPTHLMQRAVIDLLDYVPPLAAIAERQELTRQTLKQLGYHVWDASATFFVYAQCPIRDDFAFVSELAEHGVLVMPSSLFHESGCFRISVTARTESLRAGLRVLSELSCA